MNPAKSRHACAFALIALALSACGGREAPVATAGQPAVTSAPPPMPREALEPDTANATIERAAPPTLRPLALGRFEPGNPVAEAMTGVVEIEDGRITAANGAAFLTERVAIVRGGDEYAAGQRYADVMSIDAGQPVELRRVIEETRPTAHPDNAFCGRNATGYFALASHVEGDYRLVKLLALEGGGIPAATATGTTLCASTFYLARP
ncbi:hypothetical protein [Luteimonas sp. MC1825]|uniref:hypothetical protein n=1 Tax=Luteimonas sp. MC1825 TaxID=2761107 RepID=UPI001C86EBBC|nr:hypothetical protein [Luteimonas sp. MC1825]